VLEDSMAALVCAVERVLDGGDHLIVIGRVEALRRADDGAAPLIYYRWPLESGTTSRSRGGCGRAKPSPRYAGGPNGCNLAGWRGEGKPGFPLTRARDGVPAPRRQAEGGKEPDVPSLRTFCNGLVLVMQVCYD
jgi:hypothetical protein